MNRTPAASLLLALGLVACKGGKSDSTSDAWWQIDGDASGGDADGDDGDDEDDEDDEDDDEEEDFAILWGEVFTDGGDYEGEGGVEIVEGGALVCGVFWELSEIADTDGCDGCEAAVSVTIGEVEVEESSGCADAGVDPESFAGATSAVGWQGERVLIDQGAGFEEAGEGWIEDGEMGWEIWLGDGEED